MELKMAINQNNTRLFKYYGNLYPNPTIFGIFTGLDEVISQLEIPNYDKDSLNLLYFQRSKDKRISGITETLLDIYGLQKLVGEDYYTPDDLVNIKLIQMIKTKNLYNWSKLVDTYKKEYDMLSPFKMVVDEQSGDTLSSTEHGTNAGQSKDTTKGDYQGFNSTDYNPVDKNESNSEDSSVRDSQYSRVNNHTRQTDRHGNIGNRSSQELIKEERGVWVWNIYNQIFSDVDKVLTKGIY